MKRKQPTAPPLPSPTGSNGPEGDSAEGRITAWLIEESRETGKAIRETLLLDEKMLATGFALFGTGAIIAIANNRGYLLMALPFGLAILLTFSQYQHGLMLGYGGYKSVLEEAIACRLGKQLLVWESRIAPTLHMNAGAIALRAMSALYYLVALASALWFAIRTTRPGSWGHDYATAYVWFTVGSTIVSTIALAAAARWARRQFVEVATVARRELLKEWKQR